MATNDSWVHFAGDTLGRHRHVCAFFNSVDEEYRVLRSSSETASIVAKSLPRDYCGRTHSSFLPSSSYRRCMSDGQPARPQDSEQLK
jgi:hypothetical protein